jgi:hypothetical protein
LIWIVDPEERMVQVLRGDRTVVRLEATDEIDGGDVLPDFRCPVESFFEGIC